MKGDSIRVRTDTQGKSSSKAPHAGHRVSATLLTGGAGNIPYALGLTIDLAPTSAKGHRGGGHEEFRSA